MPDYSYACNSSSHAFDIHPHCSDDSITVCPECQGHLKKVFGTVGISFKGSGFYATDSRASNSSTVGSSRSESSSTKDSSPAASSSQSSSSSESSAASTPAAS